MFSPSHNHEQTVREYRNYVSGPGREIMKSYKDLVDFLEHHTGQEMNKPRLIHDLSNTLSIQVSCIGIFLLLYL